MLCMDGKSVGEKRNHNTGGHPPVRDERGHLLPKTPGIQTDIKIGRIKN